MRLFAALREPLAGEILREARLAALVEIAPHTAAARANPQLREALAHFGPNTVWTKSFLTLRTLAYREFQDPLFEQSALDLREFFDLEPVPFDAGLGERHASGASAKEPDVAAR